MTDFALKEVDSTLSICGNCIHHRHIPQFKETCEKLGVGPYHKICEKFQFNWQLIQASKVSGTLLEKVADIPDEDLLMMADFLRAERLTRRKGFKFMMPVYVRLFGDNFLSNYAKGWVITAAGRYVYIQGKESAYNGAFLKSSIIKEPKFIKIAADLVKQGKIIDPNTRNYTKIKAKNLKGFEDVPTIDSFVARSKKPLNMSFSYGEREDYN